MQISSKSIITLTSPDVLRSPIYYRSLWLAVRNIDIPRRDWLEELANTFRDFEGDIQHPNTAPYHLPLIDDVFGDDLDMRWMGYYLRADKSGEFPQSKSRKIERLQILDLYFRIKYPHIAMQFSK